jgi:succinyl-diaminopimelate desuccinylase
VSIAGASQTIGTDALGTRALELAQALVRFRTVGENEAAPAEFCAAVLADAGWKIDRLSFAPGREQLIARTGDVPPGRCLCGHLDTVAASDGDWSVDPFAGVVAGGCLWGRGAADMKGGVGAILAAAESLAPDLRHPGTAIVLTAAEETGAEGAAELAGHDLLRDVREWVVAEPTDNRILVGHRGALWLRLRAHGRPGHASAPPRDGGAIGALRRALDRLEALASVSPPDPELGSPTVAITGLAAGRVPNVIPAEASSVVDARFTASGGSDRLQRWISDAAGAEISVERIRAMPAVDGSPTGALALKASRLLGSGIEKRHATYFTDLSHLARDGVETVILGPGEVAQAHAVDERCSVEAIAVAARVYRGLLSA